MAYKVLFDGNGGPVTRVVGVGDFVRFDPHNMALVTGNADRDAMAAQLKHQTERAEMAEVFIEDLERQINIAGATLAEVVNRLAQWFDADHGERLADVRAEAGRAGFIAGTKLLIGDRETNADEYAANVRAGGTNNA